MVFFTDADSVEMLTRLSWVLEEGSRKFYAVQAERLDDRASSELFSELVEAEEKHKEKLAGFLKCSGHGDSPASFPTGEPPDVMEGGIPFSEGLKWSEGKLPAEILEFSMAMETNAYDLYMKMMKRMKEDPEAVALFKHLAEEERLHLQRMGKLLEVKL